jgi:alkylation response protein AidB-like acyl-CoA dehydrogenase
MGTSAHASAPAAVDYSSLAADFRPVFARIAEGALEREASRTLPFEPVKWLNEAKFGALRVPREYGGYGATIPQFFQLLIELAEADSNVAHLYRSHFGFCEFLSLQDEAARQRWFARFVAGETVGNASTEIGGTALGAVGTTATPAYGGNAGGTWLLNGEKYYSTGSIFAEWIAVTVQADGATSRSFAVVSTADPGVRMSDDWDGFGQTLTGTGTTVFSNARVHWEDFFDRDLTARTHEAAFFQLVLLAVEAGIGKAVLNDVREQVQHRNRTFTNASGKTEAPAVRHDPLIQQLVGQISGKAFAAEAIVLAAARELEAALDPSADLTAVERFARGELAVEKAQLMVPDLVMDAAKQLFDTLGASATSQRKQLDRHWRNARTVATHNPTVFKARIIGDYELNGTEPTGSWTVGTVSQP